MDLADHRRGIDAIDRELLELFQRRLRIAGDIASYKHEHELPVLDSSREEQKLRAVRESAEEELAEYCEELFRQMMAVSRAYQEDLLGQKR